MTLEVSSQGAIPTPVRYLVVALLVGGLTGGIINFLLIPGAWPWPMPALAYRFLGGAAAAYSVGSFLTLRRRRWPEHELLMATVLFYGFPLVAAILLQPDLVEWSKPSAWGFFAVVTPALIISMIYTWRYRARTKAEAVGPISPALRTYLLILGVLSLLVGLFVFVAPKESGIVWPWAALGAWKPLDSRLIASMLLTIGGAALLARWRNDRGMLLVFLVMLWAYCVVAGIGLILHAAVTPAFVVPDAIYVIIFAVVSLAGLMLYRRESRNSGQETLQPVTSR